MSGSLFGLGLKNIFGLFFLFILMIVVLKIASIKWTRTPDTVRDIIQTI